MKKTKRNMQNQTWDIHPTRHELDLHTKTRHRT